LEGDLTCSLKIEAEGYHPFSIDDIYVKEDISLGNIYLFLPFLKLGQLNNRYMPTPERDLSSMASSLLLSSAFYFLPK
jgi:hypothetical protein